MLQTIRERTQGWIASIIITVIILTFALWGIHSYFVGGAGNSIIAQVNGVEISREQLSVSYERLRRQAQTQYGAQAKNEAAIKDRALQSLIDVEVLKQASIKQGFRIFDTQIDSYLQSMPDFQVNGQFSLERFQEVLSSTLLSTGEFLDLIKTSLLIDQPKLGIIFSSFSLPDETDYTIALVNQERDIAYINIPLPYFLSQPIIIHQEKIQAYYDQHKNDFMTKEQINIEYVELSLKDLSAKITPTDTMLKNFYNENINSYTQPIAKETQPKIQAFEIVKNKVKEAYIRQHAEEKFAQLREQLADLAYEHPDSLQSVSTTLNLPIKTSEFFTKEKVGNDISRYQKVRDAAFSNDVISLQNNSDVIQVNPETIVVLRIKSHVPSALLPLKDVAKQIEGRLKIVAAEERATKFVADLKAKLVSGADADNLAISLKLTWNKIGYTGRYAKKVDPAILEMAFSLPNPANVSKKVTYGVTKLPNGYAIVALKSVKPGVIVDQKQYAVFAEQVQNSQGLLEYELYHQSQTGHAKIEVM